MAGVYPIQTGYGGEESSPIIFFRKWEYAWNMHVGLHVGRHL